MDTLGVGLIGCGNISSIYLNNVPTFQGLELRGVSDIAPEAAKAQGAKYNVPVFTVDELLARDDIDIVINLTIPDVHLAVSMDILRVGKHVYSEKPLGIDFAEAKKMVAEADKRGLCIGCAPDTFLGAGGRLSRKLIDDGLVGDILSGTVFIMSHGHEHWHPNPGFFYKHGGGPVFDMCPYYIHALVNLLGPVKCVRSIATTGFAERTVSADGPLKGKKVAVETPTTMHALLEFISGANIMLGASWDVWAHGHLPIELYGTKGSIRVPDPNFFGGAVETLIGREDWVKHQTASMPMGALNWPLDKPDRANYRSLGIAEIAAKVRSGSPQRVSGNLALHTLEVMIAIVDGNADGTPVEIATQIPQPAVLAEDDAQALFAV
ncbi:MAG: oxidoreductase [Hyphomicrobiales bacterium]|nr:MAG: oxidoreductase [Hyphomicrobiales bacterium]